MLAANRKTSKGAGKTRTIKLLRKLELKELKEIAPADLNGREFAHVLEDKIVRSGQELRTMNEIIAYMKEIGLDDEDFLTPQNPMCLKRFAALLGGVDNTIQVLPNFPDELVHSQFSSCHSKLTSFGQILKGRDMRTNDTVYENGEVVTRINLWGNKIPLAYESHSQGHHITILDGDVNASLASINVALNVCPSCVVYSAQFFDVAPIHKIPGLFEMAEYLEWVANIIEHRTDDAPPSCVIVGRSDECRHPVVYKDATKMADVLTKLGEVRKISPGRVVLAQTAVSSASGKGDH